MSKKDELQSKNKLKCKLYYNKNKNELKTLKEENTDLKDEIKELKLKLSFNTDIYDDDDNDDDDNDDDDNDDDDDIEPDEDNENENYYKLYDEVAQKTKNFNLVYIKDYERNINNNLLKYQNLFLDNLNEKTLDNKRIEWLLNMKKYLNGSNNEYETVYYPYQIL